MKNKYCRPEVNTYNNNELEELIQAGACSSGYSCHCHSGSNNTK